MNVGAPSKLSSAWAEAWPQALAAWSRYTQIRPPLLLESHSAAKQEGLEGSFAMIRLQDQVIVVDLTEVAASGVTDYAVEILAHEIGHHVLAPATLTNHARCLALMRRALPTLEGHAPMVANLYTDLLINDRLQRTAGLRMGDIYRILGQQRGPGASAPSAVWSVYLRIYELLWSLPRGSLGGGKTNDAAEGDAWLGMKLVRSYAADWLAAAGKFAALLLPHLLQDRGLAEAFAKLQDTREAGAGGIPAGLTDASADDGDTSHPSLDPRISGLDDEADTPSTAAQPGNLQPAPRPAPGGQQRQPFEYAEILRAAGWPGSPHDAAIAYYRELARRHLVRYPRRPAPESTDTIPEGLAPWDIGDPLDACDWFQTILQSPRVVPGLTTVQRVHGPTPGREPASEPIDLDLYVDSSGSMPDPKHLLSYPALAGAIIVLAALRAGARVQATLWSGKHQFQATPGFIRDEEAILRVLTSHYGGGTQFPLHALRDTFARRRPDERPAHILSLSDDGVTTMFDDRDERLNTGWAICAAALARGRAGGTLALNIPANWERGRTPLAATLTRARDEQGWHVHAMPSLEGLVAFARAFSRQKFGPAPAAPAPLLAP
jgi:hypothetical protein